MVLETLQLSQDALETHPSGWLELLATLFICESISAIAEATSFICGYVKQFYKATLFICDSVKHLNKQLCKATMLNNFVDILCEVCLRNNFY